MKKILIAMGVFAAIVVGILLLLNTQAEKSKITADPYEISIKQINNNIKNGSLLIDVRTAKEYEENRAMGAVSLPLENIQKGKLPDVAKDKIIYVYCHSGRRAAQAKAIFEQAGYDNVISLTSLYNWVSLGGRVAGTNPVCTVDNADSC